MKVLVTGASGFIGRVLCARLSEADDVELVATVRRSADWRWPGISVRTKELAPDERWDDALASVDVVVHAAARAQAPNGHDGAAAYRRVNVDGALNLARQAASCGVKRFVFLSSAKVNGDNTQPGSAFRADDRPAPADAYAVSKHEAELGLASIAEGQGMEIVTIRPPLVYGPAVKANFLTLMRWVYKGYPRPRARVDNRRSFIAAQNLVDLVQVCCAHPLAANETFMAADGDDVSTAELIVRLGVALGRPARLVPVPPKVLMALATVAGKRDQASKLLGNLQIDARRTRERLGWEPPVSMEEALQATARHFLEGLR
jgi:nucleoside-diphosphate-sugar epimerase